MVFALLLALRSTAAENTRECCVCTISKPLRTFPRTPLTEGCEHKNSTCDDCITAWVYVSLNNQYQPRVECPQCDQVLVPMKDLKNRPYALQKCNARHWRIAQGRIPGYRWCLEVDCMEGRMHQHANKEVVEEESTRETKVIFMGVEEQPAAETDAAEQGAEQAADPDAMDIDDNSSDDDELFICDGKQCAGLACVICDRPWHDGRACSEYAHQNMRHLVEDALSVRAIAWLRDQGRIKDCPNCQCPIEKNGPRMEVYCTRCICRFRWDEV